MENCKETWEWEAELDHQTALLDHTAARCARLERRHAALVGLTREGVLETDEAGTIMQVSRRLARWVNMREEHLAQKPLLDLLWERDYQMLHNALRKVTVESIQDWEVHLQPRNGPPVKTFMSAVRLDPDQTSPATVFWLFREA